MIELNMNEFLTPGSEHVGHLLENRVNESKEPA